MPWQLPPLCVVAYWSLITHVVYLAHVAATEHYSDQSKCVFKYFNVRYDFTSVHPLLLEWVHTFETAFVMGLAAHACGGMRLPIRPLARGVTTMNKAQMNAPLAGAVIERPMPCVM